MKHFKIEIYKIGDSQIKGVDRLKRIDTDQNFDESMLPRKGEWIVTTEFRGIVIEVVHIFKEDTHIVQITCREEY